MNPKTTLEPGYHKVFVDLCVEQKLLGNMLVMQHLVEPFQQKTHKKFTEKQFKSHWDAMVKEWKIWCKLVQCNEMKWDPKTETFGASDEDWDNYLQVNPDAGSYRFSPPLFLKNLETLFEGSNFECRVDDEAGSSHYKRKRESEDEEADISTPKKGKWWPRDSHDLFIDLLVQEASKGNRPGKFWPQENWSMMAETINRNTRKNYTIQQVKHHWTITKTTWTIWCQIVGADIMKWDPNTRTFRATHDDWNLYLKENPRALQFRWKQIPCADKLAIIFKGDVEPGKAYFRPYRKKVTNQSESSQPHNPSLYTKNEDEDDDMSKKMVSPARDEFTKGECMECLDSMQEVEKGGDLYLFALDLFSRKEYREIFLQLKKSSLRMAWMLKLQSNRSAA